MPRTTAAASTSVSTPLGATCAGAGTATGSMRMGRTAKRVRLDRGRGQGVRGQDTWLPECPHAQQPGALLPRLAKPGNEAQLLPAFPSPSLLLMSDFPQGSHSLRGLVGALKCSSTLIIAKKLNPRFQNQTPKV